MSKNLTLSEIQRAELDILLRFDSFCEEEKIAYSLAYGTLLGAVRHNGFIPWDDDIDIAVSRPDYEKIIEISARPNSSGLFPYELKGYLDFPLKDSPFIKLVNPKIETKSENESLKFFLGIDIFPIDALPNEEKEQKKIYKQSSMYQKLLLLSIAKSESCETKKAKAVKFFLELSFKLSPNGRKKISKKLAQLSEKVDYGSTDYVGTIGWGFEGLNEIIPYAAFEEKVNVVFEGYEFPAMRCWDMYLRNLYGEYMKLPSPEDRVSHSSKATLLDC